MRFDIPSVPAANAIAELSRQAHINILACGEEVAGVITNAVCGTFAVSDAVALMLAGTSLTSRTARSGAIFVFRGAGDAAGRHS